MTTPADSFFSTPELLACLAKLLPRKDVISFSRTSRLALAICLPLLWQSLDIRKNRISAAILNSPQRLQTLAANVSYVRFIAWKADLSRYYINAVYAYLRNSPLPAAHQLISIDALTHHRWGNIQYPAPFPVIPMPPLLQLIRYEGCLTSYPTDNMSLGDEHDRHLHQTLWIVRLSSTTLTHLYLSQLQLGDARVIRDVCWTISQLKSLVSLRLSYTHASIQAIMTLFRSCPDSLVEFKMTGDDDVGSGSMVELDPGAGDWNYGYAPLAPRETPLPHLRRLCVPNMLLRDVVPALHSLLERCSALESLQWPILRRAHTNEVDNSVALWSFAEALAERCPHISELSFLEGCHWGNVLRVLETIPDQRLTSLSYMGCSEDDAGRAVLSCIRHSTTLQRIELIRCSRLKSSIIQAVLTNCRALEVFKVRAPRIPYAAIALSLAHAIEHEWVCRQMRELEIVVKITRSSNNPTYYLDSSRATWTKIDHYHWDDLRRFYAQIGRLTNLEVLDLKAINKQYNASSLQMNRSLPHSPSSEVCLPGLLALEDPTSGRGGYLSSLSGMTKLRELRGSFVLTHPEVQTRIGEREIDWFANNLPALEVATFAAIDVRNTRSPRPHSEIILAIQRRRPGLKICEDMLAPSPRLHPEWSLDL